MTKNISKLYIFTNDEKNKETEIYINVKIKELLVFYFLNLGGIVR